MQTEILSQLNAPTKGERLQNLKTLLQRETQSPPVLPQFANNHIHTFYSFSPYSPAAAVWFARAAGLNTAGLMDHDSIAGAEEFICAGELAGVATTVGMECRVSVAETALAGRRINNPDQCGIAYMALHSVPHSRIPELQAFFAPLRKKRNARNAKILENINRIMREYGIGITMDAVLSLSQYTNGGSVTERHLLYALALEIVKQQGGRTVDFLQGAMRIPLNEKEQSLLRDGDNSYVLYDLLGVLKANLVERIYEDAAEECLSLAALCNLAQRTGALLCYAYLGDVGDSVTGDKKAQCFEDSYLELLFTVMRENGVGAITYMPSRNSKQQLMRVMALCKQYGFMEISGEDINSPRQKFICEQLALPEYSHLIVSTRKLIERELAMV